MSIPLIGIRDLGPDLAPLKYQQNPPVVKILPNRTIRFVLFLSLIVCGF